MGWNSWDSFAATINEELRRRIGRAGIALDAMGIGSGANVADLWDGRRLGPHPSRFSTRIQAHGAELLRLSPL